MFRKVSCFCVSLLFIITFNVTAFANGSIPPSIPNKYSEIVINKDELLKGLNNSQQEIALRILISVQNKDNNVVSVATISDNGNLSIGFVYGDGGLTLRSYKYDNSKKYREINIQFEEHYNMLSFNYDGNSVSNVVMQLLPSSNYVYGQYVNINLGGLEVSQSGGYNCNNSVIKSVRFEDEKPTDNNEDDSSFWDKLLDFFKKIFVPSNDFFKSWLDKIKAEFDRITGNISSSLDVLKNHIEELKNINDDYSFMWTIKDNAMFSGSKGITVNIFSAAVPYLKYIRGVITAFVCIVTIIFVYKSVSNLAKGE